MKISISGGLASGFFITIKGTYYNRLTDHRLESRRFAINPLKTLSLRIKML